MHRQARKAEDVRFIFTRFALPVAILCLAGCMGKRTAPGLCGECRGQGCRLACGVCAGEGRIFDGWDRETCRWCHGSGRTWERVPVRRVEKQPDGSEKTVTRWVTRRTWCRHCGGRGSRRFKVYHRCSPCNGAGHGEFAYVCAFCEGTGEPFRDKTKKPERLWVEAE